MSDLIRDFIRVWSPDKHRKELLAALDAERAEHQKEVENIKLRCLWLHSDLEKQVADLKKKNVCVNCEGLLMTLKVSQQKYDQHIEHLKQRISYLEGQQGLEYFDDCGKYWCCPVRLQGVYLLKNESMAQLQDDQKGG